MNVADEILELLESSGAPLSGEEMARQLGVSRNAVWKAVQRLREDGYQIEAATNRGYQLVSADNALTPQSVRRLLEGPAQSCAIEVRDSVTSTNTVLKGIAEQGGAEGMALIAQQQTQGKGRLGRSWNVPRGETVAMSVLFHDVKEDMLPLLPLVFGLAAAKGLSGLTGQKALIKWPNDVVMGGKKLAALVKGCSTCTGPNVTMPSSTLFKASGSASSSSRKVTNPALSSLIGLPLIEPETSSIKMQGQRGSGLLAKSLVANVICSLIRNPFLENYRGPVSYRLQ